MSALSSAAALRNRAAIRDTLAGLLPVSGTVLEAASGTGEHLAFFAPAFPSIAFVPSDPSPEARLSTMAHTRGLSNVLPAIDLDVASPSWPIGPVDAILCINMVHISPWSATVGLMAGAVRHLRPGGLLFLYGPWREEGKTLAPSNAAFDDDLKARNPAWGLRTVEAVKALAKEHRLEDGGRREMPVNNLSLWFKAPG